jgi:hypothetical protein
MLTLDELRAMRGRTAGRPVLSVYLAAEEHDPAQRTAWRRRLDALLDAARAEADAAQRGQFDAARARVEDAVAPVTGFLPGPGWAAFAAPDTLLWHGSLPAPAPDRAAFRSGPLLAPALRSLKQARPVLLALVDERRARVFRYVAGAATETHDLRADPYIDDLSDANTSKRAATHSGVRGATATDAARRTLQIEMGRMLDDVAALVLELAGDDAIVLYGGSTEAAAGLRRRIAERLGDRADEDAGLYLAMPAPAVEAAIERLASRVSVRLQAAAVEEVLEHAGTAGRAVLGRDAAQRAAEAGQVDRLLLSRGFTAAAAEDAERLIGLTLDRGGDVEEVGGAAGALLDERAGGVGARLRYARPPAPAPAD